MWTEQSRGRMARLEKKTGRYRLTAGALAADLPMRSMAPAPAFAGVPVFTWTGFYVGVSGGYLFNDSNNGETFGPRRTGSDLADFPAALVK